MIARERADRDIAEREKTAKERADRATEERVRADRARVERQRSAEQTVREESIQPQEMPQGMNEVLFFNLFGSNDKKAWLIKFNTKYHPGVQCQPRTYSLCCIELCNFV